MLTPQTILFFEEVQYLDEALLFLKGCVDLDPRRRIVATGSSSFTLQGRTRESLAGRARRTLLLPFSLDEVAASSSLPALPAVREQHVAALWKKLVTQGGYPEPWLAEEPEPVLRSLVEAFVLRDISDLHTIERPAVFRKLLELAAADIGNLINQADWASLAQASTSTVHRYLAIAEEAHLVRRVPPFVGGRRAEITATPKIYFLDTGLRNALFGGFAPLDNRADRGALWENAVFSELAKNLDLLDEIRFWRTKNGAEVDFVVRRQGRLLAIEVKATALQRPKITRAARSFVAAYSPEALIILHSGDSMDDEAEGVPILFRRPWELSTLLGEL